MRRIFPDSFNSHVFAFFYDNFEIGSTHGSPSACLIRRASALGKGRGGAIDPPWPGAPYDHVRAIPGSGQNVPFRLLGSSLYRAQLAAMLGLPYVFASRRSP